MLQLPSSSSASSPSISKLIHPQPYFAGVANAMMATHCADSLHSIILSDCPVGDGLFCKGVSFPPASI
ncbi:unnamed protein product [Fusarium graminearum]|nr:unnamed protein product [Fusarium graminearum]